IRPTEHLKRLISRARINKMIANFRHRASPATTQVTIRFFEPHKATIDGPAVSLLQEMSLDSRVASERRVALAKACGAVVFCRGAAIIDGGLVKAVQNVLEFHGYEVAVIDA